MLSTWLGTSAEIDALFDVYHPSGDPGSETVRRHWRSYQGALYQYGVLACCTGAAERAHAVKRIKKYVGAYGTQLDEIFHRVSTQALNKKAAWTTLRRGNLRPYYNALGLYLLQGPAPLGTDLQASSASLD